MKTGSRLTASMTTGFFTFYVWETCTFSIYRASYYFYRNDPIEHLCTVHKKWTLKFTSFIDGMVLCLWNGRLLVEWGFVFSWLFHNLNFQVIFWNNFLSRPFSTKSLKCTFCAVPIFVLLTFWAKRRVLSDSLEKTLFGFKCINIKVLALPPSELRKSRVS